MDPVNEAANVVAVLLIVLLMPQLRRAFFFRPPWSIHSARIESRDTFFDVLKGLAIVAVVVIHAFDFYIGLFPEETSLLYPINTFARFAIPLFLIASGVLLNPVELTKSIRKFYTRKLVRIMVPYVILTALFSLLLARESMSEFVWHVARGDILVPYYFVIVLFELYLLYPLLVRLAPSRWFLPATLSVSVVALLFNVRYLFGIPLPFELLFFFAYGISMRPALFEASSERREVMPWILIGLCYWIAFFALPGYYYNAEYFWGLAVFNLLFIFRGKIVRLPEIWILEKLGKMSLWIFLLHYPIVFWLGELFVPLTSWLPIPVGVILLALISVGVTAGLSAIITIGLQRIKKGKSPAAPETQQATS